MGNTAELETRRFLYSCCRQIAAPLYLHTEQVNVQGEHLVLRSLPRHVRLA